MRLPPFPRESAGLVLLVAAVGFNVVCLAPEIRISELPLNDGVLHLAATERLSQSLAKGEPFLDPWVSEWSLGYPMWRSYQPLPHLIAGGVLAVARPLATPAAAFAFLEYLLLALLPVSIYVGGRRFGLTPVTAGIGALLALLPSGGGELGRFGLGYGAFTWRGSGLFTQLVALHFLALAIGETARALDSGKGRVRAALLLAATGLSHMVMGYAAVVVTAVLALVGLEGQRSRRLVRASILGLSAALLVLWFLVPLVLARGEVNHSRWESPFKWDSFGAPVILNALAAGDLLDFGRWPLLTGLSAAGGLVAVWHWREVVPRRLLAGVAVLLLLFFGRATWGHLLLFAGVPGDLHLHRLQAPLELSIVWLAAWGLARIVERALAARLILGLGAAVTVALCMGAAGYERVNYLADNARWGDDNRAAFAREAPEINAALDEVQRIVATTPGRVSAGLAARGGKDFKVGAMPFYGLLSRRHFDQASFLYHAMSLTSEVMVTRDENDAAMDTAFGVRAVVAERWKNMPPHLRLKGTFGRIAVYEASSEGYVGLVDLGGRYAGPAATFPDPNARWLTSPYPPQGIVFALGGDDPALPSFSRWQAFPEPAARLLSPRGQVRATRKRGETLEAEVALARPCHALVKITWSRDLVATVDGAPAPVARVTPGFAAVPMPAGEHTLRVWYAPGPLKPLLFVLGLLAFLVAALATRRPWFERIESSLTARLTAFGAVLTTPRVKALAATAVLTIVALRPLWRGQLVSGHDATEYLPRLAEFWETLAAGQVPPVWAAHLSAGHGQPLFEFASPVVYLAALPFQALGLSLTDCLQFGLFGLFALGAWAIYRLGRRFGLSRPGAVTSVVIWLFVPYVALDLFVRTAFAEATSLALAPLALLGLLRVADARAWRGLGLAGLSVALLTLTHNGGALLLIPAVAAVAMSRAVTLERPLMRIARVGTALVLGLGASAFFWLPSLLEKDFVKIDLLRQGDLDWRLHGLSVDQLLWGTWGFGLSQAGPNDGMSFALGFGHLGLAVLGVLFAFRTRSRPRRAMLATLGLVAVVGACLTTNLAQPIWELLPLLQYLTFPWRALMLPALALPCPS